jgi:hypothetical protein
MAGFLLFQNYLLALALNINVERSCANERCDYNSKDSDILRLRISKGQIRDKDCHGETDSSGASCSEQRRLLRLLLAFLRSLQSFSCNQQPTRTPSGLPITKSKENTPGDL